VGQIDIFGLPTAKRKYRRAGEIVDTPARRNEAVGEEFEDAFGEDRPFFSVCARRMEDQLLLGLRWRGNVQFLGDFCQVP